MYISEVHIKGFRNFRDAKIVFARESLIIGCNEIGKSNLLYALRLLLDRTLPDSALEPQDSDFYAYEDSKEIEILIKLAEATEDCLRARLKEHVSDDDVAYLCYRATRNASGQKRYTLLAGKSKEMLEEVNSRFYLRVLSLKFIASSRDLRTFVRTERRRLLEDSRSTRTGDEELGDAKLLDEIGNHLGEVTRGVSTLSYVRNATTSLNAQLQELSFQNEGLEVRLSAGETSPAEFVDDLGLTTTFRGKDLAIGGDGRNNQIQIALWAARNRSQSGVNETNSPPLEVNIFCIEEPEAHLHPHQQRKLATYLAETFKTQVILTTHSPQVTCAFPPKSIIRLYQDGGTQAADDGSSGLIDEVFLDFGHRLDIIPAEAFFANVVMLVEGRSEELLYRALASSLADVDLDRLNISV